MTADPDQAERNRIAYEANRAEHEAGERFKCSSASCGADVGEPCRTKDGSVTQHPHRSRQLLSGHKPVATPVAEAVTPAPAAKHRDIFRQAIDLRDAPRECPTDVLVGAAIENALGKFDTAELQAIVTAADSLRRAAATSTADTPADTITPEDEPPF